VFFQIALKHKGFAAEFTLERSVVGVHAEVLQDILLLGELLAACLELALEGGWVPVCLVIEDLLKIEPFPWDTIKTLELLVTHRLLGVLARQVNFAFAVWARILFSKIHNFRSKSRFRMIMTTVVIVVTFCASLLWILRHLSLFWNFDYGTAICHGIWAETLLFAGNVCLVTLWRLLEFLEVLNWLWNIPGWGDVVHIHVYRLINVTTITIAGWAVLTLPISCKPLLWLLQNVLLFGLPDHLEKLVLFHLSFSHNNVWVWWNFCLNIWSLHLRIVLHISCVLIEILTFQGLILNHCLTICIVRFCFQICLI